MDREIGKTTGGLNADTPGQPLRVFPAFSKFLEMFSVYSSDTGSVCTNPNRRFTIHLRYSHIT